jgi:hypothetical protein
MCMLMRMLTPVKPIVPAPTSPTGCKLPDD